MESTIFSPTLKVASARRKLTRWTEANVRPSPTARGTLIAHYLVYKLLHIDTNKRLNRDHHLKIKKVFEKQDFDHIRNEMKANPEQTYAEALPASKEQVSNFRILHHTISDMDGVGMPYLHSLFNGLVKGALVDKKFYDAYYFRTIHRKKKKNWVDCTFHQDIEDGQEEWDFTNLEDKSPITFYFPLGNKPISLDMEYTVKHRPGLPKLGRPRKKPFITIQLDPGDVLIFATTSFRHRTSRPTPGIKVPDRVNFILSGYSEAIDLTWDFETNP